MTETRSQRNRKTITSQTVQSSDPHVAATNVATARSDNLPVDAEEQAQPKRKKGKQEPNVVKRPKRGPQTRLLKKLEEALYELEDNQDSRDLLREELQEAKTGTKQEKERNKELRAQNAQLKAALVTAEDKARRLAVKNEDLTVDLLKQQPASQTSDSQVAEKYEQLRESISSWVDTEVTVIEDALAKANNGSCPELNLFSHGRVPEFRRFLAADHALGGEYLVESLVQLKLHELLFSNDMIFFALFSSEAEFLHAVEHGLAGLDPPRERFVGREILRTAGIILPGRWDDPARTERFHHRVLVPAMDLAVIMKTSATPYGFSERMTAKSQFAQFPLRPRGLSNCTMVDVDTRETLKANRTYNVDDRDLVVEQVLLLAPGLLRCDLGKPPKRLTPDIVCVKPGRPNSAEEHTTTRHASPDRPASVAGGSNSTLINTAGGSSATMQDDHRRGIPGAPGDQVKVEIKMQLTTIASPAEARMANVIDLETIEEKNS
ncbi:MAG: hypothetical protein Q9225_001913 [Loekoesia sp. 1 TL-2023]